MHQRNALHLQGRPLANMEARKTLKPKVPPIEIPPTPISATFVHWDPAAPYLELLSPMRHFTPIHHFKQKHEKKPAPIKTNVPQVLPYPLTPEPPYVYSGSRASSVYSRPESDWERPDCWDGPQEEEGESTPAQDLYTLPATVYRPEASRKPESVGVPSRPWTPIIPEPSPSPDEEIGSPPWQQFVSLETTPNGIREDYGRAWGPLPPTPPTPSAFTYESLDGPEWASSPRHSPEIVDFKESFKPVLQASATKHSLHADLVVEDDEDGSGSRRSSGSIEQDSTDFQPRGRTRQRTIPSYYFRELTHRRFSDGGASSAPPEPGIQGDPVIQGANDKRGGRNSGRRSSVPNSAFAKSAAAGLLSEKKVKTLSGAYHQLLMEEYQDLAAEGRAWEAFHDIDEEAIIDQDTEAQQDIEFAPSPLTVRKKGPLMNMLRAGSRKGQNGGHVKIRSKSSTSPTVGIEQSIRRVQSHGKGKRNDSVMSGDMRISRPSDALGVHSGKGGTLGSNSASHKKPVSTSCIIERMNH